MKQQITQELKNIAKNFMMLSELSVVIERAIEICIEAIRNGKKIIFCGNGGSAADSQHLAAELVGRYKTNRRALAAISLTVDTSVLTAVANDFGYIEVFRRQLIALGQPGDVLIGLSTSGNSENVALAMETASTMQLKTIALTGILPGKLDQLADLAIKVPAEVTNHIQEMHLAIGHLICDFIERNTAGNKALFLDRDGVVNIDFGYTYEPAKLELMDGIIELCQEAQRKGYLIIIITNQSGIERGYFSSADLEKFHQLLLKRFADSGVTITDIFYCPYLEHQDRKPNHGMFIKARDRYGLEMSESFSVGDQERDLEAARRAGVLRNYLLSAKSATESSSLRVDSLRELLGKL